MGSYPRKNTTAYIKERIEYTFHDPAVVTEALVSQVLSITTDTQKCPGVLRVAKSTQRHYVADLFIPNSYTRFVNLWKSDLHSSILPVNMQVYESREALSRARVMVTKKPGGENPFGPSM